MTDREMTSREDLPSVQQLRCQINPTWLATLLLIHVNILQDKTCFIKQHNRPLSRRLDRCDRVIHDESDDSNGAGNV